MKSKSMAAWHAALFKTVLLIFCLLLVPMIGQAKSKVTDSGFEKVTLVTIEDFIRHAASEETDIHDLYFDLRPYEGTKTCLMCHEGEGAEMLDAGHFKWKGKTAMQNISYLCTTRRSWGRPIDVLALAATYIFVLPPTLQPTSVAQLGRHTSALLRCRQAHDHEIDFV
jgi:hypothetical protein